MMGSGCASNPYRKFYNDKTGGKDLSQSPNVEISAEGPKILNGTNPDEDRQRMLENSYFPIGYSSFTSGSVDQDDAIKQAKAVHASIVMVYSNYLRSESGVVPMSLPHTQTSQTSLYGSSYGSGGYNNFSGTATTTTSGRQTTYVPYSISKYSYYASFWMKSKSHVLGALFKDLSDEDRQLASSNKGAEVFVVVKKSPAFEADILKGDIIKKIEDHEIIDARDAFDTVKQLKGQEVNIQILRDGKVLKKHVQLNDVSL